jgi:hypothetical protein
LLSLSKLAVHRDIRRRLFRLIDPHQPVFWLMVQDGGADGVIDRANMLRAKPPFTHIGVIALTGGLVWYGKAIIVPAMEILILVIPGEVGRRQSAPPVLQGSASAYGFANSMAAARGLSLARIVPSRFKARLPVFPGKSENQA